MSEAMAHTQSFDAVNSIYICMIPLELTTIIIKYQGSNTNPLKEHEPTSLLFLVALFCHAIALKSKTSLPSAIIIHVSGVITIESLLWILAAEFWRITIINMFLLLALALSFYNDTCLFLTNVIAKCFSWIQKIFRKFGQEGLIDNEQAHSEAQQGIEL